MGQDQSVADVASLNEEPRKVGQWIVFRHQRPVEEGGGGCELVVRHATNPRGAKVHLMADNGASFWEYGSGLDQVVTIWSSGLVTRDGFDFPALPQGRAQVVNLQHQHVLCMGSWTLFTSPMGLTVAPHAGSHHILFPADSEGAISLIFIDNNGPSVTRALPLFADLYASEMSLRSGSISIPPEGDAPPLPPPPIVRAPRPPTPPAPPAPPAPSAPPLPVPAGAVRPSVRESAGFVVDSSDGALWYTFGPWLISQWLRNTDPHIFIFASTPAMTVHVNTDGNGFWELQNSVSTVTVWSNASTSSDGMEFATRPQGDFPPVPANLDANIRGWRIRTNARATELTMRYDGDRHTIVLKASQDAVVMMRGEDGQIGSVNAHTDLESVERMYSHNAAHDVAEDESSEDEAEGWQLTAAELRLGSVSDEAPSDFCCPITGCLMRKPVTTVDGETYEKAAIRQWLRRNSTSPLTNLELASKDLVPNKVLKRLIVDYVDKWRAQVSGGAAEES
eukprot:m.19187 g.19187  ORF g.19187 m.19187 type:complete len:506 (+) comp7990_c0_seq2:215-1732(+)